jgi:hypothetical protein
MILRSNGIDIYYIDESHDSQDYVVTAVAVPMLRPLAASFWQITWPDYFEAAKNWRKVIAQNQRLPRKKELHASKLLRGEGQFLDGKHQLKRQDAVNAYRQILSGLGFLPDGSIFSVAAKKGMALYGNTRLEAAMHALFQRMRRQCQARNVNAIAFFDEGHPEYRKLYRKAQVYLQTGSSLGAWHSGATRNLPLDMFFKDANEKKSHLCLFTQIADLVAYAAFLKVKAAAGRLASWQQALNAGDIYSSIPIAALNTSVQNRAPKDGIVRLP